MDTTTAPASGPPPTIAPESWVPISALNHFVFCPRRCYAIHVEGIFIENHHTLRGRFEHEKAHTTGETIEDGVSVHRNLYLYSRRHGLVGRSDVVEVHEDRYVPIEYKHGPRRPWHNDEVQLCAQALCLEEMENCHIPHGFLFHRKSQRRRRVVFDAQLRQQTQALVGAVRTLLATGQQPPAVYKTRCKGCSLRPHCLPQETQHLQRFLSSSTHQEP